MMTKQKINEIRSVMRDLQGIIDRAADEPQDEDHQIDIKDKCDEIKSIVDEDGF